MNCLACTPDGRVLLSGGADGTFRIWDAETGREMRIVARGKGPVNAVAISNDSRTIIANIGDDEDAKQANRFHDFTRLRRLKRQSETIVLMPRRRQSQPRGIPSLERA